MTHSVLNNRTCSRAAGPGPDAARPLRQRAPVSDSDGASVMYHAVAAQGKGAAAW